MTLMLHSRSSPQNPINVFGSAVGSVLEKPFEATLSGVNGADVFFAMLIQGILKSYKLECTSLQDI